MSEHAADVEGSWDVEFLLVAGAGKEGGETERVVDAAGEEDWVLACVA